MCIRDRGYRVLLLDADGTPADEGEISLPLTPASGGQRPLGLMVGYLDDESRRRRLQELRLSHQPLRGGKCADRACARGRGGGGSEPGRDASVGAQGLLCAARRRETEPRGGAGDLPLRPR